MQRIKIASSALKRAANISTAFANIHDVPFLQTRCSSNINSPAPPDTTTHEHGELHMVSDEQENTESSSKSFSATSVYQSIQERHGGEATYRGKTQPSSKIKLPDSMKREDQPSLEVENRVRSTWRAFTAIGIGAEIIRSMQLKQYEKVIYEIKKARINEIELDFKFYNYALDACVQIVDKEAFNIYNLLKEENIIVHEVYKKILEVCRHKRNIDFARVVVEDCIANNVLKPAYLRVYLSMVCQDAHIRNQIAGFDFVSDIWPAEENQNSVDKYYALLRQIEPRMSNTNLYVDIVVFYCMARRFDDVLRVLRHVVEDGLDVSPALCDGLLTAALFYSHINLLSVLVEWFLQNDAEVSPRMEHGKLRRLMQVAAAESSGELAAKSLKLMLKNGYQPQVFEYSCAISALLRAGPGDINAALEVLLEAQSQGITFFDDTKNDSSCAVEQGSVNPIALSLQNEFSKRFSLSVKRLDDFYFSLVDLVRANYVVPRLALNSIIIAAGRMRQPDRALATFQEYSSLFGQEPDLHTHNALLQSLSLMHHRDGLSKLLHVLQQMEEKNIQPDGTSFSVLLQVMAEFGELSGVREVLDHMKERGVCASNRSLRLLTIALAEADSRQEGAKHNAIGHWDTIEIILALFGGVSDGGRSGASEEKFGQPNAEDEVGAAAAVNKSGSNIPRYFMTRLNNIKSHQKHTQD